MDSATWHVGTGQRIGAQSAGLVIRVTVGQTVAGPGGGFVVVLVGSSVMMVVMRVCVDVGVGVTVVLLLDVVGGCHGRRVEEEVGVGQASWV